MIPRESFRAAALAAALVLGTACKDGGSPSEIGPPAQLVLITTTVPLAPAGTPVTTAIQLSVRDANGHPVPNAIVAFAVTAGSGSLAATADTSDASGLVTVPTWTLGKSHITQTVQATVNTSVTKDIDANVQTSYDIVVRFFGTAMSSDQQALFTNAAARLEGIVIGDVIDADTRGQNRDLGADCNVTGQPPLNELIDDVIIYASIQAIDGPGKILAQSGPCLYRNAGTTQNPQYMPAVGEMEFDSADLSTLAAGGSLQEVITHEMLHVLGFGVLWEDRNMVDTTTTPGNPRFTGDNARQGCVAVGGSTICAQSVPLENGGGAGTRLSHWRETTFGNELMTGFINSSPNPISKMTIGSMVDLGYVVNNADFDFYQWGGTQLRAAGPASVSIVSNGWERRTPGLKVFVLENGKIRQVQLR